MFQNINDYDGDINFNSEPLIEFLTMHGEVAKDRGEESIDTHWVIKNKKIRRK